jgi:hypothetical protein
VAAGNLDRLDPEDLACHEPLELRLEELVLGGVETSKRFRASDRR